MLPEWVVLLLVMIVGVVWFLSNLFAVRRDSEERPAERVRRTPSRDPLGEQPRRSANEMDRFLEEVRRRRQVAEQPEKTPRARASAVDQPPRERPVPRPQRPVSRPAEPPRRQPERAATARPGPMAKPVAVVVPSVIEREAAVVDKMPELEKRPIVVPATVARPVSPGLARITGLLHSPDMLQTAMVLREIFDAPLCKRRRR